jgi:hypothetical protein
MINILIVFSFFLWRVILFQDSLLAATKLGRDGLIPVVLELIRHHFRFRLSDATPTYASLRHHHLLSPVIMFSVILRGIIFLELDFLVMCSPNVKDGVCWILFKNFLHF